MRCPACGFENKSGTQGFAATPIPTGRSTSPIGSSGRTASPRVSRSDRRARSTPRRSTEAGTRRRAPGMQPFAQLALARVLLRTKDLRARDAIEAALDETSRFVEEWSKAFGPFVCLERAELARLLGDETTRQRELREAHRLFTEMGAPIRAAEVAKELGLPS